MRIPIKRRDGSVRAWALVDDEDYERLLPFNWIAYGPKGYPARGVRIEGRKRYQAMARDVVGLPPGDPRIADHINRDPLDTRRANLRIVTAAQNSQNLSKRSGCASRFRGVCPAPKHCRTSWRAVGRRDGKTVTIGYFHDEIEAARAAEAFRQEHMPFAQPDPELAALSV